MKKYYFLIVGFLFFGVANAQIVNIPDANFKNLLLASNSQYGCALNNNFQSIDVDVNNNNEIEIDEALNVYRFDIIGSSTPSNMKIYDLEGIESFTNLISIQIQYHLVTNLNFSGLNYIESLIFDNNSITVFDATLYPNLKQLSCNNNQLSNLVVANMISLESINCNSNQLQQIDLSGLSNLKDLSVNLNQLASIDLSDCLDLESLSCSNNQLSLLEVANLSMLNNIFCSNNSIVSLNLSGLSPQFIALYCENNQLSTLDLTGYSNIQWLRCGGNNLVTMFLKNGSSYSSSLNFSNNPTLEYICADELKLPIIQSLINNYGYNNCFVNSYCTFFPGGEYYTINGTSKYDNDNNGCDILDFNVSNLKFSVNNSGSIGTLYSNIFGSYQMPVIAGITTVIPILENSNYFSISPVSFNVNFPIQNSPYNQNFCVLANGYYPDLEINLLPIECALPGFDVKYKIIYKNKGTTSQSGIINLLFNDSVLDFMNSNPIPNSQSSNILSWNFNNLLPFKSEEIDLTLNLNSPTDIPAVNSGYLLNFSSTISGATDETPLDNISILNQTVVNSFDPNDKTCLEGATITPSQVGKYVHYMIRFENTGTANAQNVVIKDMIDTAKFDVNSLIPINGSHSFVTRITATNKVEFIFENINLPFDDANNDGYVAFKIKTKPTLVLGDTFSNTASIYFDYNFPIITDPAVTTVANILANQDFVFANHISINPNPASDILNITSKDIEISSISIYNTLGQLVQVIPNAKETKIIDVSELKSGNYFIKVISDKGMSSSKFIKD
jgi:hypothetical protein